MECGCKIGGETGRHMLVPCQGHREWMEANVKVERDAHERTKKSLDVCAEKYASLLDQLGAGADM